MDAKQIAYEGILHSGWSTSDLAGFAYTFHDRRDLSGYTPVRDVIAGQGCTITEARAYYESLCEDDRRSEAAEALAECDWTIRQINFRMS